MTPTANPNELLLSAIDVLHDTLPFIPALVGLEEAAATSPDVPRQTVVMLVKAIQAGLTCENEIAAVVLASLLAQDPLSLVGVCAMALDTAQRRSKLEDMVDAAGTPIPRVHVALVEGAITYSLQEPQ